MDVQTWKKEPGQRPCPEKQHQTDERPIWMKTQKRYTWSWVGDQFWDSTTKAQSMKGKKLNFIKIKTLCSVNDTVKRIKFQAKAWKKTFAKHILDKGPAPKKQILSKSSNRKTNNTRCTTSDGKYPQERTPTIFWMPASPMSTGSSHGCSTTTNPAPC